MARTVAPKCAAPPDQARAEDERIDPHLERLIQLQHPHILPFLDYGFEKNLRFTIGPYIPGQTLAHKTRTSALPFNEILNCGTEVASALDYLHREGIIHRVLKTSNILLDMSDLIFISSAGLVSLHVIALLLRGEAMPDLEHGWAALKSVNKSRESGIQQHVKLLNLRPEVLNVLDMVGFSSFFEIIQRPANSTRIIFIDRKIDSDAGMPASLSIYLQSIWR